MSTVIVASTRVSGKRARLPARRIAMAAVVCAGTVLTDTGALRAQPRAHSAGAQVVWDGQIPTIESTTPASGAAEVSGLDPLVVRFRQPMATASLNSHSITLVGPTGAEPVEVRPGDDGMHVVISPHKELLPASRYTLFISGATDDAQHALPLSAIGFDTAAKPSASAPSERASLSSDAAAIRDAGSARRGDIDAQWGLLAADERERVLEAERTGDSEDWLPGPQHFKGRWRADRAASPLQTLPPLQAPPGVTALSGQVLSMNGRALPGVTLRVGDREIRSDVTGRFLLQGVPPGFAKMEIDGASANVATSRYGYYAARIELKPRETTIVPYVIWMPRLDPEGTVHIASPTTSETTITSPRIPGLELHIPAGTVIRDRLGHIATEVNVTAIPVDRPPFPVPDLGVPVYFTVQPGGSVLQSVTGKPGQGARLFYPNFTGEVPGARGVFWNYDPEDREWFVYGMGTISRDGKHAIPDDGVVIHEFTGAMFNGPNGAPPNGRPPCPPGMCCPGDDPLGGLDDSGGSCGWGGDPVSLVTGQFDHTEHDLRIADVMPIDIARSYNSADRNQRAFGIGMTHAYDVFLFSQNQWQEVDLILPGGTRIHYARTSPGTGFADAIFTSTAAGQWNQSIIARNNVRFGWDLLFRDGRKWYFQQFQPLLEMADANGNVTRIVRQDSNGTGGKVARIISPNGRTVDFSYNAAGFVSALTDRLGRSYTYNYDAGGRLVSVVDPLGGTTAYTWDTTNNRITSIQDPNGNLMIENEYDGTGRVHRQTLGDGNHFSFSYTTQNGFTTQTEVTDQRGTIRRVDFDATGNIVRNTFALGLPEQQVTTYELTNGLLAASVDALNRRTEYAYDAQGNTTRITRAAGTASAATLISTYDPVFNQVLTVTDPNNHVTTFDYDAKGNLLHVHDPLGQLTSFTRDNQGRQLTRTDPLGRTTTMAYEGADLIATTGALGRQVSYVADAIGRVFAAVDPMGNRHVYDWDDLDRRISVTDPLGGLTSFAYDPRGNLLSHTDANGNTTTYAYNSLNKVHLTRDARSKDQTRSYELGGELEQKIDRNGRLTHVTYDALGRARTIGLGATATNPHAYTVQLENTWDAADRLTQIVEKTCADPVNALACGNVASTAVITRSYDTLDRLVSEVTPQGEVDYTYDSAGRRTSMTIKNGPLGAQVAQPTITYTYDAADRLTDIRQAAGTINGGQAQDITFAYDAAGQRTLVTLANGSTISYAYDAGGEVTAIDCKRADGAQIGDLQYEYDPAGRRISVGGSLARLNLPGANITGAAYDANNRLLTWAGHAYTYDDEGNLAGDGTNTYQWDERNRLRSIHSGASEMASFQYDSQSRRISKALGGVVTGFLYDGPDIVQELQGVSNTAPVTAHLLSAGIDEVWLRLAGNDGANLQSVFRDANNSTVMLLGAAQDALVNYTYEPYGATTADATTSNAQQYTGRENDDPSIAQGLYYYRARYYMPGIARFISEDPIGWESGQTNNYAYVGGDPIRLRDPSGLDPSAPNENNNNKRPPRGIDPNPDFERLKKRCYHDCDVQRALCESVCVARYFPWRWDSLNQCLRGCEGGLQQCRSDCAMRFPDRPLFTAGGGKPTCQC